MSVTYREDNSVGYIEFDQSDSKVNILTAQTIKDLDQLISDVEKNKKIKALIIQSSKPGVFVAGADITEIESIVEAEDGQQKATAGQDLFNKIEDLSIPTLAIIDGVALGGGCELAISCLYRIATHNPKVKIGLPEVNLGFVPGFGGTYRLPRLVGLSESLKMILSGKPVNASKALRIGLVDQLIPIARMDEYIQKFLEDHVLKGVKRKKYQRRKKKGVVGWLESNRWGHSVIFSKSRKSVMEKSQGFYPAPLSAIDVISKSFYQSREEGLALESQTFGQLAITDISKNLVNVFYLMEKYKKLSVDGADDIIPQDVKRCGVLGAGIMGGGIAQLLSSRDIWVRLKDINYEAVGQGFKAADKIYRKAVKIRKMNRAQANEKMAHITGAIDYSGFAQTDFVIEAVVEKMEVKKKVFKELSDVVADDTILATNTSALSVTEMAAETKDPSKVIGFHFFNPVHRMPLVEIITTPSTSKETIVSTLNLVKKLGKTPILVKDSSGFIVNRILLIYMAEAGRLLEETGDMEAIDKIVTDFGMPMGPFLLSDEVGLDVGLKVMRILEESFGERFKAADLFDQFFKKGHLGKKTGKGFYLHGKSRSANPEVEKLLAGRNFSQLSEFEMENRMIYLMINEAARCLEERIVDEPHAIDVGMIFGTGFPPFRGGLLRYADHIGIKDVVAKLQKFQKDYKSAIYRPCQYLVDLKEQGQKFYSKG